jgi:hypothetical protein
MKNIFISSKIWYKVAQLDRLENPGHFVGWMEPVWDPDISGSEQLAAPSEKVPSFLGKQRLVVRIELHGYG